MKKLLLILPVFSLLAISNAYANSCGGEYQASTGTCRVIGPDGRMIMYNSTPPQSSSNPSPQKIIRHIIVDVPSKYGALAINEQKGGIGGSINMSSLAEAKKEAIKKCENGGSNAPCKVITWVKNGCFALAAGKLKGAKWRYFHAAEKPGLAESIVLNDCKKYGVSSCKLFVTETCSVPDGMYD